MELQGNRSGLSDARVYRKRLGKYDSPHFEQGAPSYSLLEACILPHTD